jgi:hypothetical protein
MIHEELFTRLTADAGVSALVASRIYPHRTRFTPTYPHVVYEVTSDDTEYTFAGAIGMREANIVFRCIAETYSASKTIAEAIRTSLSGYVGTLGAVFVHAILIDGIRDDKIQKTEDADSFYYAVNVLITVHYE